MLGRVNKEAVAGALTDPTKAFSRGSADSTKVNKPPENLLKQVNRER